AYHRDRGRPAARRPGGGQYPPAAEARSLQAEGRPLHRRSAEEKGRQDRSESMKIKTKDDRRVRIKLRLRKRIAGTQERPRLTVFRSVSHIYAQGIDDKTGHKLASAP